jgi:hypothetical protein
MSLCLIAWLGYNNQFGITIAAAAGRFPALLLGPAAIHSKIIVTCWSLADQSLRSQKTLDEYQFPVIMVWNMDTRDPVRCTRRIGDVSAAYRSGATPVSVSRRFPGATFAGP